MTSRLILCADDFAMSPAISAAIARLAASDRINAISCMAIMPGWIEDERRLADLPDQVAVGLHLVLTDLPALSGTSALAPGGILPPLSDLGRQSLTGRLPLAAVRTEIDHQFERFAEATGRAPAFVDGHQHCHHLPHIRQIVFDVTARRAPGVWLRDCSDRPSAMLARPFAMKAIRSAAWSIGFAKGAAAFGLGVNCGFAGHNDFKRSMADLFECFLIRPGDRHVVMCHPGDGDLIGDTIAAARRAEYQVLAALPVRAIAEAAGLAFDSGVGFTTGRA